MHEAAVLRPYGACRLIKTRLRRKRRHMRMMALSSRVLPCHCHYRNRQFESEGLSQLSVELLISFFCCPGPCIEGRSPTPTRGPHCFTAHLCQVNHGLAAARTGDLNSPHTCISAVSQCSLGHIGVCGNAALHSLSTAWYITCLPVPATPTVTGCKPCQ